VSDYVRNANKSPKMSASAWWIRSLVGVSHFAEFRERRPVSDYVRNANKSPKMPYSAMLRKVEK